eukprot:5211168-Lingulodinium_polyedra.AAC.1
MALATGNGMALAAAWPWQRHGPGNGMALAAASPRRAETANTEWARTETHGSRPARPAQGNTSAEAAGASPRRAKTADAELARAETHGSRPT